MDVWNPWPSRRRLATNEHEVAAHRHSTGRRVDLGHSIALPRVHVDGIGQQIVFRKPVFERIDSGALDILIAYFVGDEQARAWEGDEPKCAVRPDIVKVRLFGPSEGGVGFLMRVVAEDIRLEKGRLDTRYHVAIRCLARFQAVLMKD